MEDLIFKELKKIHSSLQEGNPCCGDCQLDAEVSNCRIRSQHLSTQRGVGGPSDSSPSGACYPRLSLIAVWMSPRDCACVEMHGILFNRLHVTINPPGEFASKLNVVLAHLLKIVQEVGLEKITLQPLSTMPFFRCINLVRSGRTVAQRPLVGIEVDAVLYIRVERLHLHVPK